MTTTHLGASMDSLMEAVVKDSRSSTSRLPQQFILALADKRVQDAIDRRFRSRHVLAAVQTLPADRATGLIPLFLEFAPRNSGPRRAENLLIQLDHHCQVVTVQDGFDPNQPNPVSELPARDALPAAVAKSKSGKLARRLDLDFLEEVRSLEHNLLVKAGVLGEVEAQGVGGNTPVIVETECGVEVPFTYDTVYTVIDESGNSWQETLADYGTEIQYMLDDSDSMTVNGLLDLLGRPGI